MMLRSVVAAFVFLFTCPEALAQYDDDSGPSGYPVEGEGEPVVTEPPESLGVTEDPPPPIMEDSPPPPAEEPEEKPVRTKPPGHLRFGGGFGFGFAGDSTSIRVSPAVSYIFLNRVEPGATLLYEYRKDRAFSPHLSTHALGGSLFTRVYVFQGFFFVAEGLLQNVWTKGTFLFPPGFYGNLLLGGGYVYFIGKTAFAGASIKVNVIRNALYPTTQPFFSFGVGAQF